MDTKFKFLLLNARSIKTCNKHTNQLSMYCNTVYTEMPDVFGTVETWLTNNISDNEILLPNYITYRKDRTTRGGGLLLNIKYDHPSKRLEHLEPTGDIYNEIIACEITFGKTILVVVLCYRPPNANNIFNENLKNLSS